MKIANFLATLPVNILTSSVSHSHGKVVIGYKVNMKKG